MIYDNKIVSVSRSMIPYALPGETLLFDKNAFDNRPVELHEMLVVEMLGSWNLRIVKALPNMEIFAIKKGSYFILGDDENKIISNSRNIPYQFLRSDIDSFGFKGYDKMVVEADSYLLLSNDPYCYLGRDTIGIISIKYIIGKAFSLFDDSQEEEWLNQLS